MSDPRDWGGRAVCRREAGARFWNYCQPFLFCLFSAVLFLSTCSRTPVVINFYPKTRDRHLQVSSVTKGRVNRKNKTRLTIPKTAPQWSTSSPRDDAREPRRSSMVSRATFGTPAGISASSAATLCTVDYLQRIDYVQTRLFITTYDIFYKQSHKHRRGANMYGY